MRGYANSKINSNLLSPAAFWKWKYQRDYLNKTGGNISPRPQINSRNYPRDLLNSVFWQRCHFYTRLVAILVGTRVCVCVCGPGHKSTLMRALFSERLTYKWVLAYSPAVYTPYHDGNALLSPLDSFSLSRPILTTSFSLCADSWSPCRPVRPSGNPGGWPGLLRPLWPDHHHR